MTKFMIVDLIYFMKLSEISALHNNINRKGC